MAKLTIIEGYNHVFDTREKRNGGGVSIYIDLRIAFKKRLDLQLDKSHFEKLKGNNLANSIEQA